MAYDYRKVSFLIICAIVISFCILFYGKKDIFREIDLFHLTVSIRWIKRILLLDGENRFN